MKLDDLMKQLCPSPAETHVNGRRSVKCFSLTTKYLYRRAFSETQLMDSLNDISGFQKGYAYHFITAGDVDAMSYLRLIMRYCGKIRHLLVST